MNKNNRLFLTKHWFAIWMSFDQMISIITGQSSLKRSLSEKKPELYLTLRNKIIHNILSFVRKITQFIVYIKTTSLYVHDNNDINQPWRSISFIIIRILYTNNNEPCYNKQDSWLQIDEKCKKKYFAIIILITFHNEIENDCSFS